MTLKPIRCVQPRLTLELDQLMVDMMSLYDALNRTFINYNRLPANGQVELAANVDEELRKLNLTLETAINELHELASYLDCMRDVVNR